MLSNEQLVALIRAGVTPALGCTEPGAVALATAYARQALGAGEIDQLTVSVDPNVYKNGMAVGVPGTGLVGLPIAAALGVLIGQPERGLSVLSQITPELLEQAKAMIVEGRVEMSLNDSQGLAVEATALSGANRGYAYIAKTHTNLISLQRNGVELVEQEAAAAASENLLASEEITLAKLVAAVEALPYEQIAFLEECVEMNKAAADTGLNSRLGMAVGANFQDLIDEKLMTDDIVNRAKILTAAGADARMSGENIPVMSVAGSGNHGLTAVLPIVAVAERLELPLERLVRAIAVSAITTLYIKRFTGSLSALCGCAVAAATGASAAIVWLLNGNIDQIHGAIKNMVANLTGMICDGGKVGCALKLSTAAGVAVETALLSLKNAIVPCSNGIIFESADATIRNLGLVSNPGMLYTDKVILEIMLEKGKQQACD